MNVAVRPRVQALRQAGEVLNLADVTTSIFPYSEAVIVSYAPGQEVVGEGDPTDNYFLVVRGVFRAVKVTRDGRRQIFAFYMPGDMCGLEPDDIARPDDRGGQRRHGRGAVAPGLPRADEPRPALQQRRVRQRHPRARSRRRSYDDGRAELGGRATRLVPVDAERPRHAAGAPRRSNSRCSVRISPTISA